MPMLSTAVIRPVDPLNHWNLYHGLVCLSELDPKRKRKAWAFIQENQPELAATLNGQDSFFKAMQEKFGPVRIWVTEEDAGLSRFPAIDGARSRIEGKSTATSSAPADRSSA